MGWLFAGAVILWFGALGPWVRRLRWYYRHVVKVAYMLVVLISSGLVVHKGGVQLRPDGWPLGAGSFERVGGGWARVGGAINNAARGSR